MPLPDEVLIAMRSASICGSDLHAYQKSTPRRRPPMTMGHEVSGEIAACGREVRNVVVGDRVTVLPLISCRKCQFCNSGRENLCPGRTVLGVERDGAYAEYFTVPAHLVYRLPDRLTYPQAALVEPLAVAVHAVRKLRPVPENVAIIGAGVIGLFTLGVLKIGGAKNIIAIDIDDYKLNLARRLGATHSINSQQEDPAAMLQKNFAGVPACFEAVGLGSTLNTALHITQNGGSVVAIGMTGGKMEVDFLDLIAREIQIIGTYCYTHCDFEYALNLLAAGQIDTSLFTQIQPFSEAISAFDRLANKKENLVKIVLTNDRNGNPM